MKILTHSIVSLIILFWTAPSGRAGPLQDHPGQYDRSDIEAGSRLYATQCVACHGPNGDMVPGIELHRSADVRGNRFEHDTLAVRGDLRELDGRAAGAVEVT